MDHGVNAMVACLKINRVRQGQRGFTLTELMITLVIFAILLGIAIPSFESTIASNRLSTATNDLLGSLAHARSEAIRRGQRVTVCISADGATCAANGGWSQGWISFLDTTRGGAIASVDNANETILGSGAALPANILIQGNANAAQFVSFGSNGQSLSMAGATQVGTIRVCSTSSGLTDDRRARNLVINGAGRVISQTINGIPSTCPAP
jgi:type IV fimbrial biogenesis protein FimT